MSFSSSVSSPSIGVEGPGPDISSVQNSSDSSIPVAEDVEATSLVPNEISTTAAEDIAAAALVLEKPPIVAAEAEKLEAALEADISLISEVSISLPS
jgi:hypothetical protein